MPPDYNLLEYHRGAITAPAGCGKTQIIADTLALHTGTRPVLNRAINGAACLCTG